MKALLKITILLLSMCFTNTVMAQKNLDKLPEAERNKILIATAKQVVLEYGPEYYKPTHKVKIESGKSQEDKTLGKLFYSVTFIYNKDEELLSKDYAAEVFIWADTGKATSVGFGNGMGYMNLDKRDTTKPHSKIKYQQRPKMK